MEKTRKKTTAAMRKTMTAKRTAKPAVKKKAVKKSVVKVKRVLAGKRASKPNPTKKTGSTPRSLAGLWAALIGGSVFSLAAGLWYMQKPLSTPPPANLPEVSLAAPATEKAAPVARESHPLDGKFEVAASLKLDERIQFWSNYLWNSGQQKADLLPFKNVPQVADSAPLLPKRYDCTTFVETVAALARSRSPSDFFKNLLAIRYKDSNPTYESRNHFPEADWIPNNEAAGILKDVTGKIAESFGAVAQIESKSIDRAKWLAEQVRGGKVLRSLASAAESHWSKPIETRVPYIPIRDLDRAMEKIPNGTILNFVRKNHSKQPVLITHQGFVLREKGVVLLRHASSGGNVRTVVLRDYIQSQIRSQSSWPLIGINLNQLNGS